MTDAHHAIKAVVHRTGLTAHVIRIWEKRYGAVAPDRTGTNRRLYSEAQIERLSLLREATQAGHSISQVAKLPTEKLRQLTAQAASPNRPATGIHHPPSATSSFLDESIAAVKALDAPRLEASL